MAKYHNPKQVRRPTENWALGKVERQGRAETVAVARVVIRDGLRTGKSEEQILKEVEMVLKALGVEKAA